MNTAPPINYTFNSHTIALHNEIPRCKPIYFSEICASFVKDSRLAQRMFGACLGFVNVTAAPSAIAFEPTVSLSATWTQALANVI